MKEIMCTHLAKRGSTYYYRRKTPTELIEDFGKEVMKSLGTKDRKTAEALVRKMGAYYDDLFANATIKRLGGLASEQPRLTPKSDELKRPSFDEGLGIDDAELYASRFLKVLRASRERAVSNNNYPKFNQALDNLVADAKEYIDTGIHPFEDSPKPMWKLEAEIKTAKALRKNKDLPYTDLAFKTEKAKTSPYSGIAGDLSVLVKKWADERKPRLRSVVKMKRVIERFIEITGLDNVVGLNKRHVVAFKDGLLEQGCSPANANQYLTELNTLLNFASQQAVIETNPASGVRVKVTESAKEKRLPFDLPALKAIFNSPIYTRSERPLGGKGEAAYWLPLLALYTGARLDELCQLETKNVYQDSYLDDNGLSLKAWIVHITDDGAGQQLKNSGSRRRIPLHQELIDLGFITYVQKQGNGRVFPDLTPARAYGSLSANWSKWFGNYLRKTIGVNDNRMVFHSFRHCFKDYARAASIPSEIHNALTGHSSGDVADNYGSDKYPLRPLVEAMAKYKVTGLVIPSRGKA